MTLSEGGEDTKKKHKNSYFSALNLKCNRFFPSTHFFVFTCIFEMISTRPREEEALKNTKKPKSPNKKNDDFAKIRKKQKNLNKLFIQLLLLPLLLLLLL